MVDVRNLIKDAESLNASELKLVADKIMKLLHSSECEPSSVSEDISKCRNCGTEGSTIKFGKDKNGKQRFTPKTGVPMGAPNLPKSQNHLIFFRGTGQDARDKVTINGVTMLRQDYWIKGTFLVEKLRSLPIIGGEQLSNSHKSKARRNETP